MNYGNPYTPYSYMGYGMPNYQQRQYMQPQQPQVSPQQPIQQPTQAPMQYQSPIQGVHFVTEEEAKAFIVYNPNSSVLLIDKANNAVQLKSADNLCQSSSRYFKFIETDDKGNPLQEEKAENPTAINLDGFATKEQLNDFVTVAQYNELCEKFNAISEQLTSMKKAFSARQQGNGKQQ